MFAAFVPILIAVVPPLAKEVWQIIQDAMSNKIDHVQAVTQLHAALEAATTTMASLKDQLTAADANFKSQLAALAKK